MGIERTDLGFSLKPPQWLRDAVSDLAHGKTTSVPVPGGSTATLTPPSALQKPTPVEQANTAVESVPGGWMTIAAVIGAAIFLLPKVLRGRR